MNIESLENLLAKGSDSAMLRFTLGKLHFDACNLSTAVTHLHEAILQDSSYSAAWKLYGRVLAAAGRDGDARDAFRRGIAVAEEKGDKQATREMQVFLRRLEKTRGEDGE